MSANSPDRDLLPGADEPAVGRSFGRYRIESEIGSGGQGAVYLAHDSQLDRRVALKILHKQAVGDDTAVARLAREAQLAARIDDPSACEVYEFGTDAGVAFLAMRFVEGRPLTDFVSGPEDGPLDRKETTRRLLWMEQAAEALHKAHLIGILHRDIKPGNFMIGGDDRAVLLDFGIAKDTERPDSTQTVAGFVCGTPAYMSPEQLLLDGPPLDGRSDVYSLALTLYELVACRPAFASSAELFPTIASREKLPDMKPVVAAWGRDLQAVLERGLAVDRADRYDSAKAFADDLRRCRQRLPVHARPASVGVRLLRWSSRNRALALATGGLFVSLIAGSLFSLTFAWDAVEARDVSEWRRHVGNLVLAAQYLTAAQPAAATATLQECPEPLRGYAWHQLRAQADDTRFVTNLSDAPLTSIRTTGDGRLVVGDGAGGMFTLAEDDRCTADEPPATGGRVRLAAVADQLRVLAVEDERSLRLVVTGRHGEFTIPCPTTRPRELLLAPDASSVAILSRDRVYSLSLERRELIAEIPVAQSLACFAASTDGTRLVIAHNIAAHQTCSIEVLDWPSLAPVARFDPPPGNCDALTVSPDGLRIHVALRHLFVDRTASVITLEASSGRLLGRFDGDMGLVEHMVASPDDAWLALGESSGVVRVLDGGLTTQLRQLLGHAGELRVMATRGPARVVTGNETGMLREFEAMPAPRRGMVRYPIAKVHVQFAQPDDLLWTHTAIGSRSFDLAAAGHDAQFYGTSHEVGAAGTFLWTHSLSQGAPIVAHDLASKKSQPVIELPQHWIRAAQLLPAQRRALCIAFRSDGNELIEVIASDDSPAPSAVRSIGRLPAGEPIMRLHPESGLLAVAVDEHVSLWDLAESRQVRACTVTDRVSSLAWTADDQLILADRSSRLGVRDLDLEETATIDLPAPCVAIEGHPREPQFVAVTTAGTLSICSSQPAQFIVTLPRIRGARTIAFDRSGDMLAVGMNDGRVEVISPKERSVRGYPATANKFDTAAPGRLVQQFARRVLARERMFGYERGVSMTFPSLAGRAFLPKFFYELCEASAHVNAYGVSQRLLATYRAQALARMGRHDEARTLLQRLAGAGPSQDQGLLSTLALTELLAGNHEPAQTAYASLVNDCLGGKEANAKRFHGEIATAITAPKGGAAVRWLYERVGDERSVTDAIGALQDRELAAAATTLWQLRSNEPGPFRLLAWLLVSTPGLSREQYEMAARWAVHADGLVPGDARPELHAAALVRLGRHRQALAVLAELTAVDPFREVVKTWFEALATQASNRSEAARGLYSELVVLLNAAQLRDCELRAAIREEVRRAVYR